jgi:hypothetical protein
MAKKTSQSTKQNTKGVKKQSKPKSSKAYISKSLKPIYRFAHPFYDNTPPDQRTPVPGIGERMTDYIATKLEPIPDPKRDPTMTLAEIIGEAGAKEIEDSKIICFHATGDTGEPNGNAQLQVADAMSTDYNPDHPESSPVFFLHLGDVNYYENNDQGYHAQFYEPYKKYPGKIIAIPGNHDGEIFKYDGSSVGQKKTLEAFQKNFCQPKPGVPPAAGTIYRQMVSQPGVYWLLDAPLVNIIGLYSNIAEGPGYISSPQIGTRQKDWLTKTLLKIKKQRDQGIRKALLFAVHHPPFSNSGHGSSLDMLHDIDDCCHQSGIIPDAVLAGHSHNYQRYTRYINHNNKERKIPFIVCGCGGRPVQQVKPATGSREGDHSYDKGLRGYGYLTVKVKPHELNIEFTNIDDQGKKHPYDIVTVLLN